MKLTPLQSAAQKLQAEAKADGLDITDEAALAMAQLEAQGHLVDLNTMQIIKGGASQRINTTNMGRWVAGSN